MTNPFILHNVRILDFTWALAGPYATRLLADFGAEVIKVQSPLMTEEEGALARGYYNAWNRNKLGITLNMNKPEGVALAKRLVKVSDAVIENFTPRVMTNWGLDYQSLKKVKPDIIMVSMSVMGQKGPRSHYSGYGPTVHALSGMMRLTSFPGRSPLGPGFSYADHLAGLHASMALLGALEARRHTGEGRHIAISEVDVMQSLLGEVRKAVPAGNSSSEAAPHNIYRCKDGRWCAITVFTEGEWQRLKKALGNPDWSEDKKFAALSARLQHQDELDGLITGWTQQHTAEDVMPLLQNNGVPAGIVQDAADLAKDPQLQARGFFIRKKGTPLTDAAPLKMSASPAEYQRQAPPPGRDNAYVYGKLLGIKEPEITALKEQGVI